MSGSTTRASGTVPDTPGLFTRSRWFHAPLRWTLDHCVTSDGDNLGANIGVAASYSGSDFAQKFESRRWWKRESLTSGTLFWRLDTFPTFAQGQAAAGATALAAEVAGRFGYLRCDRPAERFLVNTSGATRVPEVSYLGAEVPPELWKPLFAPTHRTIRSSAGGPFGTT